MSPATLAIIGLRDALQENGGMMTTMTAILKTLDEVTASDRALIGGKAYNCGRLRQAGFPVPDGIVIPADAPEDAIRALADHPWFEAQPQAALFAVRSSGLAEDGADNSFAGIHETHLNVPRSEIIEAVLVCRRSAESAQAHAYRATRHVQSDGAAIGILVQRMVPARVAGVAFTINPVTGADELVINAAPGLGEALVSGQIEPDEFAIAKHEIAVTWSRLSATRTMDSATLTPGQLEELAGMLLRIEDHYGTPQDIEFCHDGTQFWIVQSRPITTTRARNGQSPSTPHPAPSTPHPTPSTQHPTPSTQHPTPSTQHPTPSTQHPDVEWTRANLAEVLPEQMSPQALGAYEVALNKGQASFMGKLLAPELGPMFKVFHGRMYMNLSQMRRVMRLTGAPAADMLRSLGHPGDIKPADEIATRAPWRELLAILPDIVRLGIADARAETLFRRHEADTAAMIERLRRDDPRMLSDRAILETMQWWIERVPDAIHIVFVMSGVQIRETALKKIAQAVDFPYARLVYPQLAAGPRSVSSQQAVDLVALAAIARSDPSTREYLLGSDGSFADFRRALAGTSFLTEFDQFLDRYGHRGRYESDWALPRMHEDPAAALFAIREQLQGPQQDIAALSARQEADAADAWREFESRLSAWQRVTLRPRARSLLRRLKQQYVWREQVRSNLTRILRYGRPYHLTLAGRFVERGWIEHRDDYFLLYLEEVGAAIDAPATGSSLAAIVAERKALLAAQRELSLPLLMREADLSRLLQEPTAPVAPASAELTGLCVSPGTVEAEVVVLRDPKEFASMRRGAILVTRATDPSWTPLFTLASGVVVEVGGMLSHASTIAREYGLPALANVRHAMQLLKTGDRVRLDASGGRIVLLSRSAG
jgi:pyruvate,water dikinase